MYMGWWMDNVAPGGEAHHKAMGCYGKLGTAAAFVHIISIQPLFFGIATSFVLLNGITIVLLMPTFILYIWFSAADRKRKPVVIQPNPTGGDPMGEERNDILLQMQRMLGGDIELKQRGKKDSKEEEVETMEADQVEEDRKEEQAEENRKEKQTTYGDIIHEGLSWIDDERHGNGKNWKWAKVVAAFAVFMSVANSLVVFFSPCFIDVSQFVCEQ